jgi:hypothetical protein
VAALMVGSGAVGAGQAQALPAGPAIDVVHQTTPGLMAAPGGDFAATTTVRNTGSTAVRLTALTNDRDGDLDGKGSCATGASLAPGDSYHCEWTTNFTGSKGATRVDTVTATVMDEGSLTATATASALLTLGDATGSGLLSICVRAEDAGAKAAGGYDIDLLGGTVHVPVGTCSFPLFVPAGNIHVLQEQKPGVRLAGCQSFPVVRLMRCDPAASRSLVRVLPFTSPDLSRMTTLTLTTRTRTTSHTGSVRLCSVALEDVPVGTVFSFTVGSREVSVPAGPPSQYGYCKTFWGFERGVPVAVTQKRVDGVYVYPVLVAPEDRLVSLSYEDQSATVQIGASATLVLFGSASNPPCGGSAAVALTALRTAC